MTWEEIEKLKIGDVVGWGSHFHVFIGHMPKHSAWLLCRTYDGKWPAKLFSASDMREFVKEGRLEDLKDRAQEFADALAQGKGKVT